MVADTLLGNIESCSDGELARNRPFPLSGSSPHYARSKEFHTEHIKLELSFDIPKRRLFGTATLTLVALNNGLSKVELDGAELLIRKVTHEGRSVPFDYSGQEISIQLHRELRETEKITLAVTYETTPRRGLFFIQPDESYPAKPIQIWTQGEDEDSRYWFPCYDSPNDKSSSETVTTVPSKFSVISNGKLIDVVENQEGTRSFHWKEEVPHSAYLNSLIVGEYVKLVDKADGVDVEYYVPPGREEEAWRSFGKTPAMIRFFEDKLGVKYPYTKYAQTVVSDFTFGGMENISATTLTESTLHDARAHLDYSSDDLVAHELAHQWFGDLLTCSDWSHGWLNEGFATYFEELFKEHDLGHDEFVYSMMGEASRYREEDAERYRRPIVEKDYETPTEVFDRHLYEKGGCVLHMLRFLLGDALFWKSMHYYVRRHARQNVETDDLRRAIAESTGHNHEAFFQQWLYSAGHPEFKVRYEWNDTSKTAQLSVSQTQSLTNKTPIFQIPAEVKFGTAEGEETFRVEISEKDHTFFFHLASKPKTVEFDPGDWILKTLDFEKPRELLMNQLESQNLVERIRGVQGLAKLNTKESVEAIGAVLLKDPFWGVQAEAAKALGSIKSDLALEALLKGVTLKHPKARRAVVKALGEYRSERAADALITILRHDESYFVESEAATSLGKTRSAKAFEHLKETLSKESFNQVIRQGVFQGCAELRDKGAIPIAIEWSKYGKPVQARAAAIGALGDLGDLRKEEVYDHLTSLLVEWEFRILLQTVQALEKLKDPKAIQELEKLGDRTTHNNVRRRAKEAVRALQEGLERSKEFTQLRDDVEKLREENRSLRSRLDEIDSRLKKGKTPSREENRKKRRRE